MLNRVLIHIDGARHAPPLIDLGVDLARGSAAKVRGLTLADTRRLTELALSCESAGYAAHQCRHLRRVEVERDSLRHLLSEACRSAGLDCDLLHRSGNPLHVLPAESQFHDLVVTGFPRPDEAHDYEGPLTTSDLVDLLFHGVNPLLIVRTPARPIRRVLIVSDGTPPSARATRQFVQQGLFQDAEWRLLAIGADADSAAATLRELADYCRRRRRVFESGWLCGSPRRALVPYARKWAADLVVLGVPRAGRVVRRWWGGLAEHILRATDLSVYAAA